MGDELMAFYRDPYGAGSCEVTDDANCRYLVRLYGFTAERDDIHVVRRSDGEIVQRVGAAKR